jgi:hypothetical protein
MFVPQRRAAGVKKRNGMPGIKPSSGKSSSLKESMLLAGSDAVPVVLRI